MASGIVSLVILLEERSPSYLRKPACQSLINLNLVLQSLANLTNSGDQRMWSPLTRYHECAPDLISIIMYNVTILAFYLELYHSGFFSLCLLLQTQIVAGESDMIVSMF